MSDTIEYRGSRYSPLPDHTELAQGDIYVDRDTVIPAYWPRVQMCKTTDTGHAYYRMVEDYPDKEEKS